MVVAYDGRRLFEPNFRRAALERPSFLGTLDNVYYLV